MEPVKVGVLGVGRLGSFHARAYAQLPEARLVGLYDADTAKTRALAAELEVPPITEVEQLLEMADAVSVAVPTRAHHRMATQCLQAHVHVLVEKPIATDLGEADNLIRLAEKEGTVLQVGHIERFNPAFRALENMKLAPMFIESHRLAPFTPRGADVAVILDLMIHDIDLILTLVNRPVRSLEAAGVAVLSENEDIANARVTFSNGAVANMTASRISAKAMRKLRLFGRDTYASADFLDHAVEIFRLKRSRGPESPEDYPLGSMAHEVLLSKGQSVVCLHPRLENRDALQLELQAFLHSIQKKQPPIVSGQDGRKALELALGIMGRLKEHALWIQEPSNP